MASMSGVDDMMYLEYKSGAKQTKNRHPLFKLFRKKWSRLRLYCLRSKHDLRVSNIRIENKREWRNDEKKDGRAEN